jgi:hypothetical protein
MTYLNHHNKFSGPVEFTQLVSLFSLKITIYISQKNSILNSIAILNRKNLFVINLKNYLFIIGFGRVVLATCFHPWFCFLCYCYP